MNQAGRTVDFRLSAWRDVTAAKAFLRKGMKSRSRVPLTITLDSYAASHRAVRQMKHDGLLPDDAKLRSARYRSNLIEQDLRHIKSRGNVMLGFKRFKNASVVIAGLELILRIPKGQFRPPLASTRPLDRCVDSMDCGALRLTLDK
ncbi:MAG: DDE-type integrase/transposase/recombinase [Burkholderiaceae bacterium]